MAALQMANKKGFINSEKEAAAKKRDKSSKTIIEGLGVRDWYVHCWSQQIVQHIYNIKHSCCWCEMLQALIFIDNAECNIEH